MQELTLNTESVLQGARKNVTEWQLASANPLAANSYFVSNDLHEIWLVNDGRLASKPLLALADISDAEISRITAFAVHAGYSLRDKTGSRTFYTAHTQRIRQPEKTRLGIIDSDFTHESVITEWQLNLIHHDKVDLESRREVLRVALPSNHQGITQLLFNDYVQQWEADFGLLHAVLPAESSQALPLYSGAVLRIRPEKFGQKPYIVPADNPFQSQDLVPPELFVQNGGNLTQIVFTNIATHPSLALHSFNGSAQLTPFIAGDSIDSNTPIKQWQAPNNLVKQVFYYRGREIKHPQGQFILLATVNGIAQLLSLDLSSGEQSLIMQLNQAGLSGEASLFGFLDRYDEIMLLGQKNQVLAYVKQQNLAPKQTSAAQDNNGYFAIFFSLFVLIIAIALYLNRHRLTPKQRRLEKLNRTLKGNYAFIQANKAKTGVELFRRNEQEPSESIVLKSITRSTIHLNDEVIATINNEPENGFDQAKENAVITLFAKEQRKKIIDQQQRRVDISFETDAKSPFVVTLYYRQGNFRLTKIKYQDAVELVLDWCWLVSKHINPEHTGKRKLFVAKPKAPASSNAPTPVVSQDEYTSVKTPEKAASKAPNLVHEDTELVNALEKLVNLKQQGFLSEEEFQQAKQKLLQDLIE
ncbi:SHOCT domain-containing protein [Thalassotalea agarivorans]|uniref:SHOCT domain-containing protein n=1 Tax=Thalassotalea agarivorans TaxID=349064 RepID=UPI0015A64AE9|nr:SHOCT domain-containing protein [Thalassotalea agarivorans]